MQDNTKNDSNGSNGTHNPWQDKWLVAYTKPRLELVALQNLERQNFEVYLPRYKKFKNTEEGPVPVFEPMFPRYILFRPSKAEQSIEAERKAFKNTFDERLAKVSSSCTLQPISFLRFMNFFSPGYTVYIL